MNCDSIRSLTNGIQHLVTLIKDENLAATKSEVFVSDKSVETTGSGDDDVWVSLLVLQHLGILLNGSSTVEDAGLNIWHVLAEAGILVLDLVGKFTSVTHDEDRGLAGDWLDLLKGGEDEHGGLTETRFSLAKNVASKNGLGNADLLNCRVKPMLDHVVLEEYNNVQDRASVHLHNRVHPPNRPQAGVYRIEI